MWIFSKKCLYMHTIYILQKCKEPYIVCKYSKHKMSKWISLKSYYSNYSICILFVIILNIYLQSDNLDNDNHKDHIRPTLNTFISLNVLLQKWRVTILWVLSKQIRQHIKMIYCLTFSSQRKHDAVLCLLCSLY